MNSNIGDAAVLTPAEDATGKRRVSPNGADNSGRFNPKPKNATKKSGWKLVSSLSAFPLILLMLDTLLFGSSSEGHSGWLQSFAANLPSVTSIDGLFCIGLLAVIIFQFARGARLPKHLEAPVQFRKPLKRPVAGRGRQKDNHPNVGAASSTSGTRAAAKSSDPTTAHWNIAINNAAREGNSAKAARLLQEFESQGKEHKPDCVSYNLVIRAFAKQGDVKGAEHWLAKLVSSGIEPTICSYNTVLDACAKAGNADACEAWFHMMLDRKIEANVISYATVIYVRACQGEEALAEKWLNKMIAAGVEPDAVSYNSMIHACGVSGNAVGAERWIEAMQKQGLEASVTTFTAAIDACAKGGDLGRAEKVFEAMISAGVEPNVVSYTAMIDACAKTGDPARAEHWHNRMIQFGIMPNPHTFSAIINAYAKTGNMVMAETWLDRSEQAGIVSDVVVYSSVIDACGKCGDAERAVEIFRRMQSNGIQPHIVAYAALARPFAYRGDWQEVERIAKDMSDRNIVANEYFIYAQLLAYATARPKQGQRAEQLFRNALRTGLRVNDHVVSALARAVGRQPCEDLMQELCQGRPVPLPGTRRPFGGGNRTRG